MANAPQPLPSNPAKATVVRGARRLLRLPKPAITQWAGIAATAIGVMMLTHPGWALVMVGAYLMLISISPE